MFNSVQSNPDKSPAAIVDIAPLIDIVFILLIFFLVTATFVRDTGVKVSRPQAAAVQILEPTGLRVSITAGGDVYMDGSRVTLLELRNRVEEFVAGGRNQSVIVIPDEDLPAGRLIEVMDAARLAGANDVAVATMERRAGS
ncbi:MAG: biopolymer transporter ExbD [Planctomycetota bacterium]|nr:biopolymer transporter ExbD [Planctomycetota bacterium]